jgi:hypothetical protein
MQERIRTALQVGSGDLGLGLDCVPQILPRVSVGDELPVRTPRSISTSFKEIASFPDDSGFVDKKGAEEDADVLSELKAAKSLLEMYKQRSGDLVHANEDLRNQLMALQIENATLKIENEELKLKSEALIKANQIQTRVDDNSGSPS